MNRKPWLLAVLLLPLLSCRPGADFKVSVRVIDEVTGKPIPDAWVLAAIAVKVEPEREPPYNRAVAGARAKTDRNGVAVFRKIEGIYWGEEPKDKLWLMLESRKPKLKRRITLIKEGDLFVFAKDYGALHHPLHFKGTPQEHAGMGPFGIKGEDKALLLDPGELKDGAVLTVKMAKPDKEYLYGSFHPDTFLPAVWAATSEKTGTSKAEKRAVYDFFVRNLAPLDRDRPEGSYRGRIKPEALLDPEVIEHFVNHAPARGQGTAVQEWMAQKALELLPPGYEEVKEYAQEILAGVREEEEGDRPLNHFYDQSEPDKALAGGETALKWGAIGYPDNPRNEWDWEDALRYYRAGQKARAYRALGHVVHLLADMAVPKSTALDPTLGAGLEVTARDLMQTAGGPAFARTPRERFESVANRSLGEPKAAISLAIAQASGLFLDFDKRLHPAAFVKGPVNTTATDATTRIAPTPTPEEQARKRLGEWKALLDECRQGKRGDEDRYFILRGMLWTYDRLKQRETPEGQAVLKELVELSRKRPDIKVNPPEALSEVLRERERNLIPQSPPRARPFVPDDSRPTAIYQDGNRVAVAYQFRIEFLQLPSGLTLKAWDSKGHSLVPPRAFSGEAEVANLILHPKTILTFKNRVVTAPDVLGQGPVHGSFWACTSLVRGYDATDAEISRFREQHFERGATQWTNDSGKVQQFCGAIDLDGRIQYRLPISQHSPDTLLDLRDVTADGKKALIFLGELSTDLEEGRRPVVGNCREIIIWDSPDIVRRVDPRGMSQDDVVSLLRTNGFNGTFATWNKSCAR